MFDKNLCKNSENLKTKYKILKKKNCKMAQNIFLGSKLLQFSIWNVFFLKKIRKARKGNFQCRNYFIFLPK